MARKGHSEEEILRVLREAESGQTVVEVCRQHGISQQTFYLWKKKYAGLGLSELRELRQLREENSKLKCLVADLSLDRQRCWGHSRIFHCLWDSGNVKHDDFSSCLVPRVQGNQ